MPRVSKALAPPAPRPQDAELPAEVYRQAVDQADIAITITDGTANILYCNAAFTRTTGYTEAETLGCNQSMLSYRTTPVHLYEALWSNLQLGQPWHGRLLNKRKDGTPYLAEVAITPVHGPDGTVRHYLGMHRDVTDMHQLEQRARNQKQLIESVIDAAPMAIALLDAAGRVILDNHAYKKLVSDLDVPEPAHLLLDALKLAGERVTAADVRIERTGGKPPCWYSCTTLPVELCDESADGFFAAPAASALLLVASDVTARHAEQEKARAAALRAMLAEEEHAATLRDSLSAALYQIEEPINVIASAVALMRGRGDHAVSGVLESALDDARQRIEGLRGLAPAAPLRDQAREQATGINLNEAVRDVLAIATPRLLAAGITVDWRPEAVLPPVLGNPLQLRLAVKTLLDNAIDAIAEMGGGRRSRRREIAIVTTARGDGVTLTLDDSGPGIPPELRFKVFEPFFSAAHGANGAPGGHLGMGLARAQQIVAEHGGLIDILDAPQGGCRIRVELPAERNTR